MLLISGNRKILNIETEIPNRNFGIGSPAIGIQSLRITGTEIFHFSNVHK